MAPYLLIKSQWELCSIPQMVLSVLIAMVFKKNRYDNVNLDYVGSQCHMLGLG